MTGETMLKVPAETRESVLFAVLDQAHRTMENTAEAVLELRDIHRDANRERTASDLRGWIRSAREDLAAVEALIGEGA